MKQLGLILLTILGINSFIFAQEQETFQKGFFVNGWRLSSFGLNIGVGIDNYSDLRIQQMKKFAIEPNIVERDLNQYSETSYPNTSGVNVGFELGFLPSSNTDTYNILRFEREIIFNLEATAGKESYIEYENEIHYTLDSSRIKTLGYCNLENEITAGGSYLFKIAYSRLSIYAGLGANMGATFANTFMFWESEMISFREIGNKYGYNETIRIKDIEERIKAVNSFYTRIYIPFGLECSVSNRFTVKTTGRIGKGFQHGFNGENLTLKATGNVQLGVKYNF